MEFKKLIENIEKEWIKLILGSFEIQIKCEVVKSAKNLPNSLKLDEKLKKFSHIAFDHETCFYKYTSKIYTLSHGYTTSRKHTFKPLSDIIIHYYYFGSMMNENVFDFLHKLKKYVEFLPEIYKNFKNYDYQLCFL